MSIWKTDLGNRNIWRLVLFGILMIGSVSPGIEAIYWHATNSSILRCGSVSIKVPILWIPVEGKESMSCVKGISLLRKAPTIFGSSKAGSNLTILGKPPLTHSQTDIASFKQTFEKSHRNVKPYVLTDSLKDCLKGESSTDQNVVNVLCELPNDYALTFFGSESALAEVRSMVQ